MSYGKLNCIELCSCYQQQYLSIDLFSYWTPGCGQEGPVNMVCPSYGSFLEIGSLVFSGTQHGLGDPCGIVHDRAKCFENNILSLKWVN